MADDQWLLKEDGYLNIDTESTNIVYHSTLNVILVFTRNDEVKVLDINSGVILQSCRLSDGRKVNCKYLPQQDKVLFYDGKNLGLRGDYSSVLLLDTILQTPVVHPDDPVRIELLLSEAVLLLYSLKNLEDTGMGSSTDAINEFVAKIGEAQANVRKGIKAQKWNTICLELPHSYFKLIASNIVFQLKRLDRQIPALSIASALSERLSDLLVGGRLLESVNTGHSQRFHMHAEATRRQTFVRWPHMDYKWALPNQMAQAGFYHQPSASGDDRAMCFTCNVCLVCWEKTDEPWSEHERHSPTCPFVKGEYTQNVPMAVTYATDPATTTAGYAIVSEGIHTNIVCTGNASGDVTLWKVKRQLKKVGTIKIRDDACQIMSTLNMENVNDADIKLHSMCTYRAPDGTAAAKVKGTCKGLKIVCGVTMNKEQFLVVYNVRANQSVVMDGAAEAELTSTIAVNANSSGLAAAAAAAAEVATAAAAITGITNIAEPNKPLATIADADDFQSDPSDGGEDSGSINKKSSLKNISYENQFDEECIPTHHDSCAAFDWKVADMLSPYGYKPQTDDEIDFYASLSSTPKAQELSKNQTNSSSSTNTTTTTTGTGTTAAAAATSKSSVQKYIDDDHMEGVFCKPMQSVPIAPILVGEYNITEIIPSHDQKYLLVILRKAERIETELSPLLDNKMDVDEDSGSSDITENGVQIFVYQIGENGYINEQPVCSRVLFEDHCPLQVCMLPKIANIDATHASSAAINEDIGNGVFAMVCADGSLQLIALLSLRTISETSSTKGKFISVTYCKNLERLCVCTTDGMLHFYSFYDVDIESDEPDEIMCMVSDGSLTGGENEISETDGSTQNSAHVDIHLPSTSNSPMQGATGGGNSNVPDADNSYGPSASTLFAHKHDLTLADLKVLYALTLFNDMLTQFSAEVPVCWNELVLSQKQRRYPQRANDDSHLTKTWRLHNDATTWDEHIIELTLPKPVVLGHVDFRFSLYQPCANPPAVQVTLLKQNTSGFGYRMKAPFNNMTTSSDSSVDDNVDFKIDWPEAKFENPVLSEEYLQSHNADIIAGPMELSSGIDLSEQNGLVMLTSPKLFKTKSRNFLVHIKTMVDANKDGQGKTRVPVRKKGILRYLFPSFAKSTTQNSTSIGPLPKHDSASAQSKTRNNDYYIGCDWLHEISIGVRGTKPANKTPNERLQRIAMLESNALLGNLLNIVSKTEGNARKNISLDILLWIISVRMCRYRSPKSSDTFKQHQQHHHQSHTAGTSTSGTAINDIVMDMYQQQIDCVQLLMANMTELMRNCILLGNRSTANKCVKIILVAFDGVHNMPGERIERQHFEVSLKNGILRCLSELAAAQNAGALRWFNLLISGTSTLHSQTQIAETCVELLLNVTKEIGGRWNQYTSILRTRFGLYGLPFEPHLFDAELPLASKYNSLPNTLVSIIKNAASAQQQNTVIDLKKFCSADGTEFRTFPSQIRRKGISNQLRGLLDVEPLHFTCCTASEATRIENMDSLAAVQANNIIEEIIFETASPSNAENASNAHMGQIMSNIKFTDQQPSDTKKDKAAGKNNDNDDVMNNCKNILADTILYSALKKYSYAKNKQIFVGKPNATSTTAGPTAAAAAATTAGQKVTQLNMVNKMFEDAEENIKKLQYFAAGVANASGGAGGSGGSNSGGTNAATNTTPTINTKSMHYIDDDIEDLPTTLAHKIHEFVSHNQDDGTALPWHKLLSAPAKQMIVIDRMHSGARRFVVLDFGAPIILTDVVIPACEDLVSLSIDYWCFDEDMDSTQLVLSFDIGTKTLVLSDLQPPPVCRFIKVTTTGRYGMSATRCKIPLGSFFGHVMVLETEGYADPILKFIKPKTGSLPAQLKALQSLYEDVHCRYSLSSAKLLELLEPLFNSDISNVAHMQAYLNKSKDGDGVSVDQARILGVYDECISFQHQLNVIQNVIVRLEVAQCATLPPHKQPPAPKMPTLQSVSSDKLRVLSECLVEVLLHFIIEFGNKNVVPIHSMFTLETCNVLFNTLVVSGDNNMQLATCSLLVRMCSFQPWWGEFLASTFTKLYSSQNSKIFPQDRVFFLLTYLGRKSITMGLSRSTVIDAILKTLATLLVPLSTNATATHSHHQHYHNDDITGAKTDFQLISWLLLFLSVCLDDGTDKKEQSAIRWEFMSGETDMSKARAATSSNSGRSFSRSFKKRFLQNKTNSTANTLLEKICLVQNDKAVQVAHITSQIEMALKQQDNLFKKHTGKLHAVQMASEKVKNKWFTNKTATKSGDTGAGGGNGANSNAGANVNAVNGGAVGGGGGVGGGASAASNISGPSPATNDHEQAFDKGLRSLKMTNTLVVIRGLIGLLLAMDYTCNMDLFLLTCKIIARLVSACRPAIQLCKIITTTQLHQLIRLSVWKDQQQPWAVHAITCLLQDILEADKNFRQHNADEDEMPIDMAMEAMECNEAAGSSDSFNESILADINILQNSELNKDIYVSPYADSLKISQLPSLMECEDAEMDDLFGDILDRGKSLMKKDNTNPSLSRSGLNPVYRSVSVAMDSRLESGLEINLELFLRRLTMMSSLNLFASLPQVPVTEVLNTVVELPAWPEYVVQAWSSADYNQNTSTIRMFVTVFDHIFADLHLQDSWLNLEQVLQLWLTLNSELAEKSSSTNVGLNPHYAPKIPFGTNAVQGLMSALSWHQGINLRSWCLGFQCLTLACNYLPYSFEYDTEEMNENNPRRMGVFIVNNPNFEKMLHKFYSSTDMASNSENRCAGPTICKLMHELFVWIENKSDLMDMCYVKKKLKEIMLRVVLQLIQPGGAISMQQGPIDAQSVLVKEMLLYQYDKGDLGVAMSIIESVSFLVHSHILNAEKVYCQRSVDANTTNNVFNNLFATVLGSENARQNTTVSDNSLLVCLLKLSSLLVQTALPPRRGHDDAPMSAETVTTADAPSSHRNSVPSTSNQCQTDETKAEQQQQQQQQQPEAGPSSAANLPPPPPAPSSSSSVRVPCVTDTVLQHYPTMNRLLSSLSQSNSTPLLESTLDTSGSAEPTHAAPSTVVDAVFQLLMLLSRKATKPALVIKPLYDFLKSTSSMPHALPKLLLSEPFLWFVLKVLETPDTVSIFTEMGGINVLCQSLVSSNRSLINMQPGLVSIIMQHISKTPKQKNSTPNAAQAALSGCKKFGTCNGKNAEGLLNFAPFCSITTENSTAQSPDVLIQAPIASHRRARTPAWTYLFYPNESHIDLVVTLPTAVLLKEVHLQPHLPSLASCPAAVALEINRDNSLAPIPISQPMSTVGLTCIKLKLPQPEIASSIVLRLYRPKDNNSIGLTQVSVLGSTVFTNSSMAGGSDERDDDSAAKSSLGWLRILARCFSVATIDAAGPSSSASILPNAVIQSAADYPGFLEACCSLLNVTVTAPTVALQNLETVLLRLGLHSRELGLKLIDNLLKSTLPQTFKLCNDSVSDLLYDICTTKDDHTADRIATMIDWVRSLYAKCHQQRSLLRTNPYSGFVKCLSSILWTAYTSNLTTDLAALITTDLFDSIFAWTNELKDKDPLKQAIDSMLCSICCIRPELFPLLLRKLGVLVANYSTDIDASISDDRKDTDGMTDDTKQATSDTCEWYSILVLQDLNKLSLTPSQLRTIALACQSPLAIHQLLDSGLPYLLTLAILEFCSQSSSPATQHSRMATPEKEDAAMSCSTSSDCLTDTDKAGCSPKMQQQQQQPMVSVDMIAEILDFFAESCSEGHMRDWLGSADGSSFWDPLLNMLCNEKSTELTSDRLFSFNKLEAATIKFLSKVTSCHPKNQDHLTVILISVIKKPNSQGAPKNIISGFTRRLVLQLLLESERILVSVRSDVPLQKRDCFSAPINNHPSKRPNAHHILFYLSTHTKCQEILDNCVFSSVLGTGSGNDAELLGSDSALRTAQLAERAHAVLEKRCEMLEFGLGIGSGMEFLSVAAGVTAKDKRLKEAKNQVAAMKSKDLFPLLNKFKCESFGSTTMSHSLLHMACPMVVLTSDTTISQVLAMLRNCDVSLATPCITLHLQAVPTPPKSYGMTDDSFLLQASLMVNSPKACNLEPLPSPLQIFSRRGGLSLLAHYLPTVYPETPKALLPYTDKERSPPVSEWVKVGPNDDIYEDLDDTLTDATAKAPFNLSVPQHSLAAFGLFLRLPTYSDVLLRDKIKAQCLLRLVLGVTGDGEGNEIFSLALATSLPTLPFEVFRQLLDSSPLTTDDGVLLRRMCLEVGSMHLVLNCLGIFTHQSQLYQLSGIPTDSLKSGSGATGSGATASAATNNNGDEPLVSDDKSHVYWAKGTGFGTGSTQQSWDVEQALLRQKMEEEHVTVLLQVLSSYVNPNDAYLMGQDITEQHISDQAGELPPIFFDLLHQSCLIPALSSYLRNDSVLDITRHIPLYRAILQLLRAIALSPQLVTLLMPNTQSDSGTLSIAALLLNMKTCVDTYASRLKVNKKSNIKGQTQKVTVTLDDGDDEGLALLIPDIQDTTALVQKCTKIEANHSIADCDDSSIERPLSRSIEHRYLELMKALQFDTAEMIVEGENDYRFVVSHHFEANVRVAGDRSHPTRVKRLAQETVTLSTSLPLSYSSSVFVRCDNDRLDVMKVLITGPAETPYANGCFEFDVYFPSDYPNSPMMINLETTGRHSVRFNPNLYNDGKVCLSVLNTWHGRPEEKWNAQTSSFLQVLVSIQSLILVPEPYFNEPGFERSRGTPSGTLCSREYNSNIYQASVRWAMLEQIKNPCPCFKEIIHTHFWLKRHEICSQIEEWIADLNKPQQSERSGRTISINSVGLRRHYRQLRDELAKLPVPEGLEDLNRPFAATVTSPTFDATTAAISAFSLSSSGGGGGTTSAAQDSSNNTGTSTSSVGQLDENSSSSDSNIPNLQIDSNDPLVISINEFM